MSVPDLPEPDQAAASLAAQEAAAARQDIESQLSDGSLSITDVFQMSDQEIGETSHRIVGHMHIRAALLALPHIGDVRADEILEEVGIEGDRHIDTIGDDEQDEIAEAVRARQPE